ncbi:MAG: hypothetical protein RSE43_10920 [Oscillospiraceae bacterium]
MNIIGDSAKIELVLISISNVNDIYKWIQTSININLPGFNVSFREEIEACSLLAFAKSIEKSLEGEKYIVLNTLEDSISLQAEISEFGKTIWTGEVQYPIDNGNILLNEISSELENLGI